MGLWQRIMQRERETQAKLLFAVCKMQNKAMSCAFTTWLEQYLAAKGLSGRLKRYMLRWQNKPIAVAFAAWDARVQETRRLRAVVDRVRRRMQNKTVLQIDHG